MTDPTELPHSTVKPVKVEEPPIDLHSTLKAALRQSTRAEALSLLRNAEGQRVAEVVEALIKLMDERKSPLMELSK